MELIFEKIKQVNLSVFCWIIKPFLNGALGFGLYLGVISVLKLIFDYGFDFSKFTLDGSDYLVSSAGFVIMFLVGVLREIAKVIDPQAKELQR